MSLLSALSPLLLLAAGAAGAVPCHPIPCWEHVLADDRTRWIVIGEMHGTSETPALFADAVCLTARSRPVVVALEFPGAEQPAIDAFLDSDGGEQARRAFLAAPMWNPPMKDGRSSEAVFRLFETLRQMRAAGQIASVVAFQAARFEAGQFSQEGSEKAMAQLVLAGTPAGSTVLVLTGNIHARRTAVPWEPRYLPMAAHLPAEATVALDARGEGGEAWGCHSRDDCGPKPQGRYPGSHERGVVLESVGEGAYSGALHLGAATTASPPQNR